MSKKNMYSVQLYAHQETMTLRNYGKQKCPNGLRKCPTAAERPNVISKYQENGEFRPQNGLRNYGKLKIPVFLMVSIIHCSQRSPGTER